MDLVLVFEQQAEDVLGHLGMCIEPLVETRHTIEVVGQIARPGVEHAFDDVALLARGAGRRAGVDGQLGPAIALDDRDRHRQIAEEACQLIAFHDTGMLGPNELTVLPLDAHALRLGIDLLEAHAPVVTLRGQGLAQRIEALADRLIAPGTLQLRHARHTHPLFVAIEVDVDGVVHRRTKRAGGHGEGEEREGESFHAFGECSAE